MEWSGRQEFNEQLLRDWVVDGKVAGRTRSAKGLTFTTIGAASGGRFLSLIVPSNFL